MISDEIIRPCLYIALDLAIVWLKRDAPGPVISSLKVIPAKGEIVLSKGLTSYSKDIAKALVMALIAGLLGTGVAVVGSVAPASAAACSTTASGYAGGDGSSGDPYQIATSAQLIRLATTSSDWSGKYFVQTADIDLGDCTWSPIGNGVTAFRGEYNGGFFEISGFSIPSSSADYVGLFGKITQSVIKNLSVAGSITSDGGWVGGLVGLVDSSQVSTITQIESKVDITYSGANYAGGIVGDLGSSSLLSFSYHLGNLTATASSGSIGGLTGFGSGTIESSYSRANFSGVSTYKSGLNGWGNPRIRRSFSIGPGADGGISGLTLLSGSGNVFWDTSIATAASTALRAGGADSAATGKTTSQMRDVDTFSATNWRIVDGWDTFDTAGWTSSSSSLPVAAKIWGICSQVNDGYPFLLWEYTSDPCTVAPPPSSGGGSSGSFVAPVVVPEAVVIPDTVAQRKIRTNPITGAKRLAGSSLKRDVVFAADSAVLTAEIKKTLRQAARLAIRDGSRLAITGFAANSPRGDGFEKRLAEKRALRVANFLREQGFENWIYFHGLNSREGSEFPGQPRRVEIRTLK